MRSADGQPLLEIDELEVTYGARWPRKGGVRAVAGLSLTVHEGRTMGLVGESGCGKSTLARTVVGLEKATAGKIYFEGGRLDDASPKARRQLTTDIQMIYQDPYASLNPRKTVGFIISEGWRIH